MKQNQNLKILAKGHFSIVYEINNNTVKKSGIISNNEIKALNILKDKLYVPSVSIIKSTDKNIDDELNEIYYNDDKLQVHYFLGHITMSKASGKTISQIPENYKKKAYDKFLSCCQDFHASGIAHNDLKPDHIYYDQKSDRITIIDWGLCQFDFAMAKREDESVKIEVKHNNVTIL